MDEVSEYQKIESLYFFDTTTQKYKKEFLNKIVEYLKDLPWIGTEKIDGANTRIVWNGFNFSILGRENKSQVPEEVKKIFNEKFIERDDMEVAFEQMFGKKQVILFVEAHGGKIQKGAYNCDTSIIGFDIMVGGKYLSKFVASEIFVKLGIDFVPIINFDNLQSAIDFVKTHENSIKYPDCKMEGLVCVPKCEIYDYSGKRIAVKIKNSMLKKLEECHG